MFLGRARKYLGHLDVLVFRCCRAELLVAAIPVVLSDWQG